MKVTVEGIETTPPQNEVRLHNAGQGIYRERDRPYVTVVVFDGCVFFISEGRLSTLLGIEECADRELIPLHTSITLTFSTLKD